MEGYVPVKRFYTVIAIALLFTNPLSYLAGNMQGDTDCKLDTANFNIINQRKVYNNDLKIDKNTPHYSSDDWGDWMRD